jgi:hypothetical protein
MIRYFSLQFITAESKMLRQLIVKLNIQKLVRGGVICALQVTADVLRLPHVTLKIKMKIIITQS